MRIRHTLLVLALTLCTQAFAEPTKPPLVTAWMDLTLRFSEGRVTLVRVASGRFATPTRLPRWTGRWAIDVLAGERVIDRVVFDFPLLGAADAGNEQVLDRELRARTSSETVVRVPLVEGAEALRVVERKDDKLLYKATIAELDASEKARKAEAPATPRR